MTLLRIALLEALVVVELLEEVFEPEAAAEVVPVDPVLEVVAEVVAAVPAAVVVEPDDPAVEVALLPVTDAQLELEPS